MAVRRPPAGLVRLAVVHALQLPAIGLWWWGIPPWSAVVAAVWASAVCCLGTDSGWRWRNRILVAEAAAWLVVALPWK